jgi:hypothetical protein
MSRNCLIEGNQQISKNSNFKKIILINRKKRLLDKIKQITDSVEQKRVMAILDCFGTEAFKEKKVVLIEETGEEINYWHIDGFINKDELFKVFTLEQITFIYDSGI